MASWLYNAAKFVDAECYTHVLRWSKEIDRRETVRQGRMVNRAHGELHEQLRERHDAMDFDTKTQDKIEAVA